MKAAPFAYVRPGSVADALSELDSGEAKVLAGGQSLVPVLAMRLGRPATLVDINAIPGLDRVSVDGDRLVIGATARQRTVEHHPLAGRVPLLRLALPWVGHRELRSRGTVCGSLAHADPAAELGAVAGCLDAELDIAGPSGTRTERARAFFTGALTTTVGPCELLTGVRFPVAGPGEGFGFAELARRHGDFALAGVATRVRMDGERVTGAVLTGFGVSDRPVTRDVTDLVASAAREDEESTRTALADPVAELAHGMVDTAGDAHGSRGYRVRLLGVLGAAELARAYHSATSGGE
ncbi:MAG TPA: FAD binding domain-containing protein [Pseudonocardiaceae bacterium]|nr:FAD binding domain-containing protein [Pseudonocardiaceae bacterium]